MRRFALLLLALPLTVAACNSDDDRFKPIDKNGIPLDRGKSECKKQAKAQAQGLAKGDIQNGVADDLYADCLQRRGYFKR